MKCSDLVWGAFVLGSLFALAARTHGGGEIPARHGARLPESERAMSDEIKQAAEEHVRAVRAARCGPVDALRHRWNTAGLGPDEILAVWERLAAAEDLAKAVAEEHGPNREIYNEDHSRCRTCLALAAYRALSPEEP